MKIKVEVNQFNPQQAVEISRVILSAFTHISESERPVGNTNEFLEKLLGNGNPAGPAVVALAKAEDRIIGCCVGIPGIFSTSDSKSLVAYQIGYFFVSSEAQGQGVGFKVLEALTQHLSRIPNSFIYTFPNSRSISLFKKYGYSSVLKLPTYILPKLAFPSKESFHLQLGFDEIVNSWKLKNSENGFIKDLNFFMWRYGGQNNRYRFIRGRSAQHEFIMVLTQHRFSGLDFTIFVDLFTSDFKRDVQVAASILGKIKMNGMFSYLNCNQLERALPLRIAVPQAFNPRPVELLQWKSELVSAEELMKAPYITGDWMGF